jgi:hypothetical protein
MFMYRAPTTRVRRRISRSPDLLPVNGVRHASQKKLFVSRLRRIRSARAAARICRRRGRHTWML